MPRRIEVTLEETPKRTFATAIDWPGWSRGGKTAELALETLASYARRYQPIVGRVDPRLSDDVSVADFHVVERVAGGAGTEFGVPSGVTDADRRPMDAREAGRRADVVEAAWAFLERTAAEAPEELRKGPRGGGRNTSKVVAHVLDADRAYANEMGIKVGSIAVEERAAIRAMRAAMLDVLRATRDGAPLAGRRWPARYAAHRIAWHALDHAWEIEDRTE